MWRRAAACLLGCLLGLSAARAEAWRDLAATPFEAADPGSDIPGQVIPTALAQDGAGFLWGASENGLLRWDGNRFRRFCASPDDTFGLRDCYVQAMLTGHDGALWVATAGGLARYSPDADRFVTVGLADDAPATRNVSALSGDGASGLWAASPAGLFHLDAAGQNLAWLRPEPTRPGGVPDSLVRALLVDHAGRIWLGGGFGLLRAGPRGEGFDAVPLDQQVPEVTRLMEDSAGRVWAGTRHAGAYVIPPSGGVHHIEPLGTVKPGESGTEIMAIAEVAGRIWLGTFGEGIIEVEGDGGPAGGLRHIVHDPYVASSLDNNAVYALHRDRSGLVWASTTHGLSRTNPSNGNALFVLHGHPAAEKGLSVGDVTGFVARPDGGIWAASEHDGVDILSPDLRLLRHLPVRRVFAMAQAPDGRVFLGTRGGLIAADASGSRTQLLSVPGRRDNEATFALFVKDGVVWAGGQNDGLYALRIGMSGEVTVLRHLAPPALTGSWVHQILATPDGGLAVASEGGISFVDGLTGPVTRITENDAAGLTSAHPFSLAVDAAGRLWVGTDNAGIDVMALRPGRTARLVRHIGRADGLPNLDINALAPDRAGQMWLSTDNGIAAVNTDNFTVRTYGRADGLDFLAFWTDSVATMPDGSLLFGGVEGMLRVCPDAVADWVYTPPLVVTDLRIGGLQVPPGLLARLGAAPTLTVPAHTGSFSVEFASLDYSAPWLNQYRTRLLGFDPRWNETDALHRVAAYTNIPPGDYVLEVTATNRKRQFSAPVTRIAVHVLPAWFQTMWFRCLEAAFAVSVVAGVAQIRTILLRARQRDLERLVAERTAALSASEKQMHQMAYFDALTALPNRRAFNEAFSNAVTQCRDFALALVDLDGFKQVNDTLGHDAGDELLLVAAARLREAIRGDDFAARLGGDEFAILLMGVSAASRASAICARVVAMMAQPACLRGGEVRIGASVGVALFPQHGTNGDEVYKHADDALYAAKRTGRGKWRWFGAEAME